MNNEDITENNFKAPIPPDTSNQPIISMSPASNVSKLSWRRSQNDSDSSGSSTDAKKRPLEMSNYKSKANER